MKARLFPPLAALLALLAPAAAAPAQEGAADIPALETADLPTLARLHQVEAYAAAEGWAPLVGPLHAAALQAYGRDRFLAADAWFHLYEWAALFAEPEGAYREGWERAVRASRVAYAPAPAADGDRPLGAGLSAEMQAWLVENAAFSEEFFSNLSALDFAPRVFAILEGLHRRSPETFAHYASLSLAIAIVYDVPPPGYWPHAQVTEAALPRRLPNPAEPFDWFTREDRAGHTYFNLARLRAEELKFVVDGAAPASELEWAQHNVPYRLDQLEGAYFMVKYRTDRFSNPALMTWSGQPYTLPAIAGQGGICIDQAYFAAEAGKARGVPTLLFGGAGQDGRHAWFGYLDERGKWKLDAGRYAEQRLVTGRALDPQTWLDISDHELQFLSERFRALPAFAQSRVQEEFARDFLQQGDAAGAARAAQASVNYERRNLDAWETLVDANGRLGAGPATQEGVLRQAVLAFSPKYPDLVIYFENRLCQSLRARGEASLADFEERGIAERLKGDRADLAVTQASQFLARSIGTQPLGEQIATYNAILAQFGRGAGVAFYDQIVVSFAEHLALAHQRPQAREAVEHARQVLDVQPGTQVAMEMEKLLARLQD